MSGPALRCRGCFVVLEGTDGVGKSTQATALAEYVRRATGSEPLLLAFPDRSTAVGSLLAGHLTGARQLTPRVLHLLFSANRWELAPRIESALAAGRHVIADRYWYSGAAYTLAHAANNDITLDWCCAPDSELPQPDIVLHLELESGAAVERCAQRTAPLEVYEHHDFQVRAAHSFDRVLAAVQSERDAAKLADAFGSTFAPLDDGKCVARTTVARVSARGDRATVLKRIVGALHDADMHEKMFSARVT